jgi:predicted RNA binding protein YcfA (HicA-like mRNA interferase family)/predicted RNase H-like HicB family nuclease
MIIWLCDTVSLRSFTEAIPQPEGGFTVSVPALPEVVTEGDSEVEAMAMAEDAIRLVLAYRRDQWDTDAGRRATNRAKDHHRRMSRSLPAVNARQVLAALRRAGFVVDRILGSHHMLVHISDTRRTVTVPVHGARIIKTGT